MYSFILRKRLIRDILLFGGIVLLVLIATLAITQGEVYATPLIGNECPEGECEPEPEETEEPPKLPPNRDDAKCKMLVYPSVITLGEPFEVCWVGHKFSDVALGPDRALTPSQSNAYIKSLDDGKTLWCNSFQVPSFNNTSLNPGTYDFRCTGPGGTILATTVRVVDPVFADIPQ